MPKGNTKSASSFPVRAALAQLEIIGRSTKCLRISASIHFSGLHQYTFPLSSTEQTAQRPLAWPHGLLYCPLARSNRLTHSFFSLSLFFFAYCIARFHSSFHRTHVYRRDYKAHFSSNMCIHYLFENFSLTRLACRINGLKRFLC